MRHQFHMTDSFAYCTCGSWRTVFNDYKYRESRERMRAAMADFRSHAMKVTAEEAAEDQPSIVAIPPGIATARRDPMMESWVKSWNTDAARAAIKVRSLQRELIEALEVLIAEGEKEGYDINKRRTRLAELKNENI